MLRRIQASKWKVLKGFTDAGIQPFDPDRVLAKCGLQHPIPAAVPVDAPPAPVLTSAQAAEQLRLIAKLQFDDPVHRIRVIPWTRLFQRDQQRYLLSRRRLRFANCLTLD